MTHLNYKRQYIHRDYKRQYLHPETKEVLNNSQYLNVKKGVKQTGDIRYLVGEVG